ncbi:unnamed protein product [Owenia fusiformis]|uniref:Uncharacterized protein n=2 Tax=Owenia fusiformis TaxID=6347 RepID=A0A8J1TQW8_OWEFU|nr:unnamed protein product [Owenia fusiformis]
MVTGSTYSISLLKAENCNLTDEKNTNGDTTAIHFDEVFAYIGDFGLFQWLLFLMLGLGVMPVGWQSMSSNFVVGNQNHWCKVDALANLSQYLQKEISIPIETLQNGEQEYSKCFVYDHINYTQYSQEDFSSWNRTLHVFKTNTSTTRCRHWVYDQSVYTSTIVSQWDLVCDDAWMAPFVSTCFIGGMFFGSYGAGATSDRFGRKKTLITCYIGEFIFALIAAFMPYYELFLVCRFLVGVFCIPCNMVAFVLVMELVGSRYRSKVAMQLWFATGFMLLALIAFGIRDHFRLQLVLAAPRIVFLLFVFILPESPRWLVTKGRIEEAKDILCKIASINKREFPSNVSFITNDKKVVQGKTSDLFVTPVMRKRTLIVCLAWLAIYICYYGLSLNASTLAGDPYFNTFLNAALEIPVWGICVVMMDKVGRRICLVFVLIFGGLMCLICIPLLFFPDLAMVVTAFSILGKLGASGGIVVIYLYSAELFPTVVRNVGVGAGSTSGRVGGMVSPQIGLLSSTWIALPSMIFGIFGLIAGVASLLLPETLGQQLSENISDVENSDVNRKRKGSITL